MATNTLNIPLPELQSALGQFQELEQQAIAVRTTVDTTVRGIGASWYGPARNAYNVEIDNWLSDYQRMVADPMTALLSWFRNMIQIMQQVEADNAGSH